MLELIVKIGGIFILIAILVLVMALPTMWLWNWLMPVIFQLPEIGFWQALGLNILSGIFFRSSYTSSKD
jgi:hypothetical protein